MSYIKTDEQRHTLVKFFKRALMLIGAENTQFAILCIDRKQEGNEVTNKVTVMGACDERLLFDVTKDTFLGLEKTLYSEDFTKRTSVTAELTEGISKLHEAIKNLPDEYIDTDEIIDMGVMLNKLSKTAEKAKSLMLVKNGSLEVTVGYGELNDYKNS